jgi:hypothetical protein
MERRKRTMKHVRMLLIVVVATFAVAGFSLGLAEAQKPGGPTSEELEDIAKDLGMEPAKCDAVQRQIDQVVSVYQSGLTDNEKIAKLTELWAQSAAALKKSGESDPDVGATAGQYLLLMEEVVAMTKASPSGDDKAVSSTARDSLKRLKILTQNYVKMIKILCPKLTLPAIMNTP